MAAKLIANNRAEELTLTTVVAKMEAHEARQRVSSQTQHKAGAANIEPMTNYKKQQKAEESPYSARSENCRFLIQPVSSS